MRRARVSVVVVVVLLGCGGGAKEDLACPAGTRTLDGSLHQDGSVRMCMRIDATSPDPVWHGPVVRIEEDGTERLIGRFIDGKQHGRSMTFSRDALLSEATYDHGELRRFVLMDGEGQPSFVGNFNDGVAHGPFVHARNAPHQLVGSHIEGRRSGIWHRSGDDRETRIYDHHGVLRSLDGRPLPPPPDRIVLPDGRRVVRASCGPATPTTWLNDPCTDLFEAIQRCARARDDGPACRERALAVYTAQNAQ